MHNSPISKEFYNSITDVLVGKTTKKVELPVSLNEAAKAAREELANTSKGMLVSETKRDILRKHLKEGAANCGCQLTQEMVTRFDEIVTEAEATKMPTQKAALATPAEVKSKTAPKGGAMAAEPTKLATPAKAAAAMKKEETETSEIEVGLREFLTQLSEEEITTLRNIINENR